MFFTVYVILQAILFYFLVNASVKTLCHFNNKVKSIYVKVILGLYYFRLNILPTLTQD